jgi:hypothetical protein
MRDHVLLSLAFSLVMASCYRSHGLGNGDGGVRRSDAAPVDASAADTGPADTGSPPVRDSGTDVLPPEPDPDLGPDARPSDYPEAMGWEDPDPSAYPADESCCTLIGEEQTLEMGGEEGVGTVALDWNGREWGLLYVGRDRAVFVPLRPLGEPGTHRLLPPSGGGLFGDIAWGGGRFGVSVGTGSSADMATFMLVDERGTLASEVTTIPSVYGATMARMTHLDRWAVAGTGMIRGGRATQLALHELDGSARVAGAPALFEPSTGYSVPPALVGLKSRMVVFYVGWPVYPGIVASTFTTPFSASPIDGHEVFEEAGGCLEGSHFRNNALVSVGGPDGAVRMAAFDPFDGVVTARGSIPGRPLAPGALDRVGLGASDGKGLVAVCVPTGGSIGPPALDLDPPAVIKLYLFGPDLEPLGLPIDVGQMDDVAAFGCEVGFSDDNILVAWWDERVPVVHVRAVRP